ncbi:MAG: hypothetical protein HFJ27_04865 [Clostridia bacterium]|nr:hypothetical protein [Clostridia bacterium]
MIKTVMKEIIIILLLILAIVLILGVFFYDYIPMNKVVPKIEPYEAPNNIKEELQEIVQEEQNTMQPIVYEINDKDLNIYEKTKDYQKGKVNPFADTSTKTPTNNNSNTVTSNSNDTSSNGTNTNNNPTNENNSGSEGNYLPSNGTK